MRRWFIASALFANALISALVLLLVPVLGISFWARDRGFRRQAAELAARQPEPPHDEASS